MDWIESFVNCLSDNSAKGCKNNREALISFFVLFVKSHNWNPIELRVCMCEFRAEIFSYGINFYANFEMK